ncbi:nucleotidyltransferase family protein [Nocardioides sp.]|uniref:nucleotidyltransferase family protein n=1 Tax=Nocardioides sp. TaxID=35761 RepID=UPI002C2AD56D|nr:nucleotidyltransferase family protein [Nocardioides sp.]HSX66097.1 nucleotidyltransferase family protein [Nocardioides sp.]
MRDFQSQRELLKSVATTLKRAGIPFALAGGYAVWSRGGPESTHDVDFVIPPSRIDDAVQALHAAGHDPHPNSEDWLMKVSLDDIVVDLIHRLPIGDVDDALLARCDERSVDSVRMPVMCATDLLTCRMLAFTEHSCDFGPVLSFARALREQVDWELVRDRTEQNPFAAAFLQLLEALDVTGHRIENRPGVTGSVDGGTHERIA